MKALKVILFGVVIWLILFIVGFAFFFLYTNNQLLFRSIMVVSSGLVMMLALNLYFRKIDSNFVTEGVLIGLVWLAINLGLDLLVLVGMFKNPVGEYFTGTGIRYLNIPIFSIGVGWLLSRKVK